MAARTMPETLLTVVRDRGAWNLANAFLKPAIQLIGGDSGVNAGAWTVGDVKFDWATFINALILVFNVSWPWYADLLFENGIGVNAIAVLAEGLPVVAVDHEDGILVEPKLFVLIDKVL